MTGYLLLRRELEGGSNRDNETILYETKVFVPFAWSVLFEEHHIRHIGEDLVVAARREDATALARRRLAMLGPIVTARLLAALDEFVTSIEAAGDGWLVLDPYRIEARQAELAAPLRWFDAPTVASADAAFGDDDGVERAEPDDDDDDADFEAVAERLDIGDEDRFAGWPIVATAAP